MKNFKRGLIICLVMITMLTFSFLTACKKEVPFVDQGEVGDYYEFADDSTISLSLNENAFTFTTADGTATGKYTFDGTALVITFDGEAGGVNVNFDTNKLTFTYKGSTYTLYRNVNYTVTFNTNGGSSVSSQTLQAGKKVVKPVVPSKDGYQFIGWYKEANFATLFDFNAEIVTSDVTLYARFEENTNPENEFKVSYVTGVEGVNVDEELTFQNTIYNLPELSQAGFVGWWVSDYEDASKLSYKFESGMDIKQDTVLYAVYSSNVPTVSVTNDKISWSSMGVNKQYGINVKNAKTGETVYTKTVSTTFVDFNFDNQAAGEYEIEVKSGDVTGKAYRVNKLLPQVCKFTIDEFKVTWVEVEGATEYKITVDCGISTHEHTEVTVAGNEYDFSACAMKADGINFVVTAVGKGYVNSVSKAYNLKRDLATVSDISVNDALQTMTWEAVEGATSYKVTVKQGEQTYTFTTEETSLTLDSYYGDLVLSVTPQAQGYYAPATEKNYAKTTLTTPTNISVTGYDVKWDAVKDAASYIITIDGQTYTSTTNQYSLSASEMDKVTDFKVKVQAVAASQANNSLVSQEVKINKEGVTTIGYANGVVTWNSVAGISKFAVKIDDGAVKIVENATQTEYPVIGSGKHTIYVTTADGQGNYGEFTQYQVEVYALNFDTQGGNKLDSIYFVKGDTIKTLPTAEYKGYIFLGWYNTEELSQVANNEYKETVFNHEADITIYADWTGIKVNATFDYGRYGQGTVEIVENTFGSDFQLPVPEATSTLKTFYGWFTEPNAEGIQYTDELGQSIVKWLDYTERKLYAGYVDIFTFTVNKDATEYAVSKGAGISYLTNIVIPATYEYKDPETNEVKQLPVTLIDAAAFGSCSTIVSINIPESIKNIEIGGKGPKDSSCCFYYCSKLENVNVYTLTDAELLALKMTRDDVIYSSIDGVLIKKEAKTGQTELCYFPAYTRGGTYVIPSTVTSIPQRAFNSCSLLEGIIIPANVVEINDLAFYLCSGLLTVTFEEPAEGAEVKELKIGNSAFQSCSKLTEVNLPARLGELSAGKNLITTTDSSNPNDANKDERIRVFDSCSALTTINVVGTYENQKYSSVDGVITNVEKDTIVYFPKGREEAYTTPVGVTTIGEYAFAAATKLSSVTISGAVTEIGKGAFKGCTGLESITFLGTKDDMALSIRDSAFYGCTNASLGEVTLPANLKLVERQGFGYTSKLTRVNLYSEREDVVIATNAFGYVASTTANAVYTFYVTELNLGASVPEMELTGAFGNKLEVVNVDKENKNYTSIDGVLYNKEVTMIAFFPVARSGEYKVVDTVTSIGDRVFQSRNITSIIIHGAVASIGESAFQSATKLESVKFVAAPEGKEEVALTIGKSAFQSCTGLTSLELPTRLTTIGDAAFASCSKITAFNIPEGVTTIGANAFQYCSKAETITLPSTLKTITESANIPTATTDLEPRIRAFDSCTALKNITVAESNENFKSMNGLLFRILRENKVDPTEVTGNELILCPAGYEGKVVIPGGVSKIANYSFYNAKYITDVTFPDGAIQGLKLGNYVFYGCDALVNLELPRGLVEIDQYAIYSCKSLVEIVIPNTVELMTERCISSLTNLTTVTFEEGNLETPLAFGDGSTYSSGSSEPTYYSVIYYCNKLQSLVLPERTTSIGAYSFTNMTSLKSISLPSTLEEIKKYAFYQTPLTEITFADGPSKLEYIGYDAFYGTKITEVILPEGIKELGSISSGTTFSGSVFYSITTLTKVVLPSTLEKIGSSSFYGCKNLSDLSFRGGTSKLTYIGYGAFSGCVKLTSFTFPETIETIEYNAFYNCQGIKSLTFEEGENGSSLKNLGYRAFYGTGITSFAFPSCGKDSTDAINTITLGYGAAASSTTPVNIFEGCRYLEEVYLSEAVTTVDFLFVKCPALKRITISGDNINLKSLPGQNIIVNFDGTSIKYIYGRLTGEFTVPDTVDSISDLAFANQSEITKIYLPAGLKAIGKKAFENCFSLKEVVFAEGCTLNTLGEYAFNNCLALESISFPNYLTELPNYAFNNCQSLKSIDFNKVTKTGNYVFNNCISLKSVELPATITKIGTYLFRYCTGLESVSMNCNFGTTAANWGNYTFTGCTSLKEVTLGSNIKLIGNYAFQNCKELETFEVPKTVTTIGTYAFQNCTALKSVTIPQTVTSLGNTTANTGTSYTFAGCTALESVEFTGTPAIKIIPGYAFQNCTSLKSFTFPASLTNVNNNAFIGSGIEKVDLSKTKVTQLGSTTSAGATFKDCANLSEVVLSSTFKSIFYQVFMNCTSLKSFVIPSNITTVSNGAFSGSGLEKVEFKAKPTTLGTAVFQNCADLAEVILPSTFTEITANMFDGCASLKTILLPNSLTKIGASAFANSGLTEITIPAQVSTLTAYTGTAEASFYSTATTIFAECHDLVKVEIEGNVKNFGSKLFQNCTSLTEVTIPATLEHIGTYAFAGCTSLTKLDFSACTNLKDIGSSTTACYSFQGCTALEEVVFPEDNTVARITGYAFQNCSSLKSITACPNLVYIGTYAFDGCSSLESFDFGSKLTTIGNYAFRASGLKEVDLSQASGLTTTGTYAFQNNKKLETVKFNDKLRTIDTYAFNGCSKLGNTTLPAELVTINEGAFANTSITKVNIPASVTSLNSPFRGCKLESVTIDEGNENFSVYENMAIIQGSKIISVFKDGGEIVIPEGVTSIGTRAFYYVSYDKVTLPSTMTALDNYAFSYSKVKEVVLNDNTVSVGNYAFEYSDVKKVVIGANPTSLGTYVFQYSDIEEIENAGNITYVGNYDFRGVENLESVEWGDNLVQVANYGFMDWVSLKEFVAPSSLKYLGGTSSTTSFTYTTIGGIFANCFNLEKVVLNEGLEAIGTYTFGVSSTATTVTYGSAPLNLKEVVIPASVTTVGQYLFNKNTNIEKVVYKSPYMYTASYAFYGCSSLKEVDFTGSEITTLGNYTFQDATAIEKVVLPEKLETIGQYAFQGCSSLKEVVFNSPVTKIDSYAFRYCSALEKINLPEGLETIGTRAFEECGLETIKLPSTTVSILNYSFYNSPNLKTVELNEGLLNIGSVPTSPGVNASGYVFAECVNLENITIPESIESIGQASFVNCTKIKSITIPLSCSTLGTDVFQGWTADQVVNVRMSLYEATSSWYIGATYSANTNFYIGGEQTWNFNYQD